MLNRLRNSLRPIAISNTKPIPRIEQRTNRQLVWRTALNQRNYLLEMLLKLFVSKSHSALTTPNIMLYCKRSVLMDIGFDEGAGMNGLGHGIR